MSLAPPRRLCLNCDNRHGCRSAEPPCLGLSRLHDERRLSGRALLGRRGLLPLCRRCELFRRCWGEEDYRQALRADPTRSGETFRPSQSD